MRNPASPPPAAPPPVIAVPCSPDRVPPLRSRVAAVDLSRTRSAPISFVHVVAGAPPPSPDWCRRASGHLHRRRRHPLRPAPPPIPPSSLFGFHCLRRIRRRRRRIPVSATVDIFSTSYDHPCPRLLPLLEFPVSGRAPPRGRRRCRTPMNSPLLPLDSSCRGDED
jgi:hypothetical protein